MLQRYKRIYLKAHEKPPLGSEKWSIYKWRLIIASKRKKIRQFVELPSIVSVVYDYL